jgi:lactate permease
LYVPFLLPFVLVSALILFIYRKNLATQPKEIASAVATRLRNPAIALFGALVLVQLLIKSGESAPANLLGTILSDWFKEAFVILTPLLGALGSFFSGSTTVSNLTFADIQFIAADSIGTSRTSILALQAVGASAGNGICLNNIIAACAVVGLNIGEGKILMQTYKFVFASTTICTIVILSFYARFDS